MITTVGDVIKSINGLTTDEKHQLFVELLNNSEILDDLLDLALVLRAEAENGETVSLEEFHAGQRTYDVQ